MAPYGVERLAVCYPPEFSNCPVEPFGSRNARSRHRPRQIRRRKIYTNKGSRQNIHKAPPRPDPKPGRQIKYTDMGSGVYTASRVRISTLLHQIPASRQNIPSPSLGFFGRHQRSSDPALPTGTLGEKFSADHGSSGPPPLIGAQALWDVGSSDLADFADPTMSLLGWGRRQ
ncbi:hypothetical protein ON010_g15252 [Phytophthora cinnamomi]|nr:hypothetical protein ON010_g15252 [Phytophthora cinnamomi]